MKKFRVEFLNEETGEWYDPYGDYIDAENAEEAEELFWDWVLEQYIQNDNANNFNKDAFIYRVEELEEL